MRLFPVLMVAGMVSAAAFGQVRDLPTSKAIVGVVPGSPQRINSLPMSMAVSPDGRYVVTVNAGYGTFESGYMQSLAVMDTRTGTVADFPDDRTLVNAKQTLYSGLAFSSDGKHVYASMASGTDPIGDGAKKAGSGVVVYGFADGKIVREKMLPIPLQQLPPGRKTKLIGGVDGDKGLPYPAAIAVVGERLLVADNLSDDVLLMDAATGAVVTRFDLSESDAVPSIYPVALAVAKDGRRAFVALWNASEVVELDLVKGTVGRKLALLKPADPVKPGTHPCALELSPDGKVMYVALANRDAVAAVHVGAGEFAVKGYFDTRLPHQTYFGAEPEALAVSADGSRLYVANAVSDAVAVIDTTKLTAKAAKQGMVEPIGFVPTEWMPMSMALTAGKLYVATAKGHGTGPNPLPMRDTEASKGQRFLRKYTYIATLLHGSLAVLDAKAMEAGLKASTEVVLESNRMKAAEETIAFAGGPKGKSEKAASKIKHIVYIIKENRTYDQVFGDLKKDGKPVGNGDPSLTMFGEAVTPNQHKLALQFGVLDNFFDSGEVSGDGHVWSTAAIGTDYLEKTWQQDYRGGQHTYDFEGVVAEGYPLLQKIPDVNEPASGYLWGNLASHGKTYYHFGEFISTVFCNEKKTANPQQGPMLAGVSCSPGEVKPGERLPAAWGGGENKWPWAIPLMASNIATKPELEGHFAVEAPDFNLRIPEQVRADIFLKHFAGWVSDRERGTDTMPNFVMLRFGNDHTAGTTPGGPTPKASIADNDLAIGRAVEAISHSAFWEDTAFFILEDDAQDGGDHVDAHRSLALVISKYAPHATDGGVFVDSRFYSTVSTVRTMETLLGLPPMNNNDAFSSLMAPEFTGPGDQAAFVADLSNRENGLIYTANLKTAPGAKASMKMDFRHADRADAQKLNAILWKDAMGATPVPASLTERRKNRKKMTTMTNKPNKTAPFRLAPRFSERIWGRPNLLPWYASTGTDALVGEAWLTGPECVIETGELAGRTLASAMGETEFPLLVKMLFPNEKLSVQVHPDDAQAQAIGQARGKTECWYVLEAEPGATVMLGLKPGAGPAEVRSAVANGTMEELMEHVPVSVGDMVFVDAGTVHAIGPGVVLLETQQTCDVTYRLYDYGRPRELHLEQGLGVMKTATKAGKVTPRAMDGFTRLIEEQYFSVDRFELPGGSVPVAMDGVGCIVGLKGTGSVDGVAVKAGEAVVVPVGSGGVTVESAGAFSFARCLAPVE